MAKQLAVGHWKDAVYDTVQVQEKIVLDRGAHNQRNYWLVDRGGQAKTQGKD